MLLMYCVVDKHVDTNHILHAFINVHASAHLEPEKNRSQPNALKCAHKASGGRICTTTRPQKIYIDFQSSAVKNEENPNVLVK